MRLIPREFKSDVCGTLNILAMIEVTWLLRAALMGSDRSLEECKPFYYPI